MAVLLNHPWLNESRSAQLLKHGTHFQVLEFFEDSSKRLPGGATGWRVPVKDMTTAKHISTRSTRDNTHARAHNKKLTDTPSTSTLSQISPLPIPFSAHFSPWYVCIFLLAPAKHGMSEENRHLRLSKKAFQPAGSPGSWSSCDFLWCSRMSVINHIVCKEFWI